MDQDPRVLKAIAEKASNGATGGFSFFGGKTEKWEKVADAWTATGNAYRTKNQRTQYRLLLS
jgi:alpha-soluble NSF attachment protein